MKSEIAIVILNWNGKEMMRRYLPSVISHSQDVASIVVADNGSTDGSLEMLKSEFPDVETIALNHNYGFAEGYNKALQQVTTHYYILLNSDVETSEGWLTPLLHFMNTHAEVAACQPKLLALASRDHFEYAGACGGFLDSYGYPFCRGRIFNTIEKDHHQYDNPCEIHWASGAALMVRSKDYWQVGGLDGRFFAHNEEIDFCWRLRLAGKKIYCVPQSHVYHLGGGTLPKGNPRKTYLNFRNNLTMLYKCLPESELSHVMRVRFWLDWLAALEMLILGRSWGDFKAVLKGRRDFKRWRKDFDNDRKRIHSTAVDAPLWKGSILWQYYAKGKKLWSALNSSLQGTHIKN